MHIKLLFQSFNQLDPQGGGLHSTIQIMKKLHNTLEDPEAFQSTIHERSYNHIHGCNIIKHLFNFLAIALIEMCWYSKLHYKFLYVWYAKLWKKPNQ